MDTVSEEVFENALDKIRELSKANAGLVEALQNIGMTADQSGLDSQSTYDGVLEDICEATQEAIRKARPEDKQPDPILESLFLGDE